ARVEEGGGGSGDRLGGRGGIGRWRRRLFARREFDRRDVLHLELRNRSVAEQDANDLHVRAQEGTVDALSAAQLDAIGEERCISHQHHEAEAGDPRDVSLHVHVLTASRHWTIGSDAAICRSRTNRIWFSTWRNRAACLADSAVLTRS